MPVQQSGQQGARTTKSDSIEKSPSSAPQPAGKSEKEHSTKDRAAKTKLDGFRVPEGPVRRDPDRHSAIGEPDENIRFMIQAWFPRIYDILLHPEDLSDQMYHIFNLLREGPSTGANRFAQDIVLEVISFNELMGQLIKPLTAPNSKEFNMWWGDSKWPERLNVKNGSLKTRLTLNILSDELRLIKRIGRIEVSRNLQISI